MKYFIPAIFLLLGFIPLARVWGDAPVVKPESGPNSFELNQCAIVQGEDRPRVYLAAPSGELEALDAATGKVIWHTLKASLPFLCRGNRLLAYAPEGAKGETRCRVEILDADTGRVLKKFKFPEPLVGPIEKPYPYKLINDSFYMEGVSEGGHDYLVWTKQWMFRILARMAGHIKRDNRFSSKKQGVFEADLLNLRVSPYDGPLPGTGITSMPNPVPWEGYVYGPFEVDGITFKVGNHYEYTKKVGGNLYGQEGEVLLQRWKGKESLPDVRLDLGGVVVCGDRQHFLWLNTKDRSTCYVGLYSTVTGEKIAGVNATSLPFAAQVCGNFLVCYTDYKDNSGLLGPRVFVMDITTGTEVWARSLREKVFLEGN